MKAVITLLALVPISLGAREDLEALEKSLRSDNVRERQEAVRGLAEEGSQLLDGLCHLAALGDR